MTFQDLLDQRGVPFEIVTFYELSDTGERLRKFTCKRYVLAEVAKEDEPA
jgi:hypothetical protein